MEDILQASKLSKEMSSQGLSTAQKIKRIVEEKADNVPNKEECLEQLYQAGIEIKSFLEGFWFYYCVYHFVCLGVGFLLYLCEIL